MSSKPKVTLIGGGSVIWGPIVVVDMMQNFDSGTIGLVDINEEKLHIIKEITKRLNGHFENSFDVESSVDRHDILPDSDFVYFMAEANRADTWQKDHEILRNHGIEHSLAENRGPGGLSHGLRTIPLAISVCEDMEQLCPEAIGISLTNPEDRIAYACQQYTDIDMYGYCSGLWEFRSHLLHDLLDIPGEKVYVDMAGINHLVWVDQVVHRDTGEDLYPRLEAAAAESGEHELMQLLNDTYGMWPYPSDDHVGEYFSFACDVIGGCEGYDFEGYKNRQKTQASQNNALIDGELNTEAYVDDVNDQIYHVFGDYPMTDIVRGIQGEETYLPSINLPNDGSVDNLQDDMIIEVPGFATPGGIKQERFGELPDPIIDVLRREGTVQRLSAEAAVEGSREKAIKSLLHDDFVDSLDTAESLLDAFLKTHLEHIPTF